MPFGVPRIPFFSFSTLDVLVVVGTHFSIGQFQAGWVGYLLSGCICFFIGQFQGGAGHTDSLQGNSASLRKQKRSKLKKLLFSLFTAPTTAVPSSAPPFSPSHKLLVTYPKPPPNSYMRKNYPANEKLLEK